MARVHADFNPMESEGAGLHVQPSSEIEITSNMTEGADGGLGLGHKLNAGAPIQQNNDAEAPIQEQNGDAPIQEQNGDDKKTLAAKGLYGEGAAWGPRDFLSRSFLAPWLMTSVLSSFWAPSLAVGKGDDSTLGWVPFAMSVSLGNIPLFGGLFWSCFCLIKGDKHYVWVIICNSFLAIASAAEIVVLRRLPMYYVAVSGILMMTLIYLYPGTRNKFAMKTIGMLCLFEIPLYGVRRFVPPLLCLADGISPMFTSLIYPIITTVYESIYLPMIFYMWDSKSRKDIPELALYFQLTVIMASSEALFFGGLIQMVNRYPEAMLPRDLIGRHSNAQYWYGIFIVLMLSICGLMMYTIESILGTQFQTLYSKAVFWLVMCTSAVMSIATEMCIAALSWWHRREIVGSGTYLETFSTLHLPGRQPYFSNLRNLFGKPAERTFENMIREPEITDTVVTKLLSPQKIVLVTAVALCFGVGPSAQALGFIASPDSASCK